MNLGATLTRYLGAFCLALLLVSMLTLTGCDFATNGQDTEQVSADRNVDADRN